MYCPPPVEHRGESPPENPGQTPVNNPIRVLVVEDNSDDSDLLVRQLQQNNFDGCVKVIADGRHAWKFLRTADSHQNLVAIFLDLNLPSLSGMRLLERIKSHRTLSSLPIFVMTSSQDPRDIETCSRLGVDGYVTKPVTFMAFSKVVADLFHAPPAPQAVA